MNQILFFVVAENGIGVITSYFRNHFVTASNTSLYQPMFTLRGNQLLA